MKSDLQRRAENLVSSFSTEHRTPLVIEFAGLPKAGKTTTLSQLQSFLRGCGFHVEVVIEKASVCPIRDKKHANFNIWTACTTLAQLLENTQTTGRSDDPEILILDRGLFDAVCWLNVLETLQRLRRTERKVIERFLLADDWISRIKGVVYMTVNPIPLCFSPVQ